MNNLMMLSRYSNSPTVWDGTIGSPDPALMKSGSTVYTVGGRAVYRHVSDKGSVIHWIDKSDVIHKTLVLDYEFRGSKAWGDMSGTPTGMSYYNSSYYYIGSGTMTKNTDYDSISEIDEFSSLFTDTIINNYSYYVEDAETSSYNTDKIIAYWPTSDYAAHFCRNNGSGIVADLPNIQTLIRVCLCINKLTILDPSVPDINDTAYTNFLNGYSAWSSTLKTIEEELHTYYLSWGVHMNYGAVGGDYQSGNYTFRVYPTLDL